VWSTDTRWFDVAVIGLSFAIGNILFGRFEEHRSRWRRMVKLALTLVITLGVAQTLGRGWAYGWMVPLLLFVVWTAEPRERYLELVSRASIRDVFRRDG
jgi:predicted MFS family arabinose efflux permease